MNKVESSCQGSCKWRGRDPSKAHPMNPEHLAAVKKVMIDNKWNTGHNPADGQNEWGFYEDGSFKTLKDNQHGTWNIEMRD
jgi:hypothetical protein